MMSFMRLNSTKILLVVLAAWVLAVQQPCCEAIASTLPHEHGISQETYQHSIAPLDTVKGHQHCPTAERNIGKIPVLIGDMGQLNQPKPMFEMVAVWMSFLDASTSIPAPGLPILYHPPPGPQNQVYLYTQRLRI